MGAAGARPPSASRARGADAEPCAEPEESWQLLVLGAARGGKFLAGGARTTGAGGENTPTTKYKRPQGRTHTWANTSRRNWSVDGAVQNC